MSQRKTHHGDGLFKLVAWGGIEPPTQGFSTLIDRTKPVLQLAFLVTSVFGVLQTSSSNSALQRVLKIKNVRFEFAICVSVCAFAAALISLYRRTQDQHAFASSYNAQSQH